MADLCRLNRSDCLRMGRCLMNDSLNTTYCPCDECHIGSSCENRIWSQIQFDPNSMYLIIYIIIFVLSVLNNSLTLELFVRSKQLRCTNCGIYLIVYGVLSLVSSISLVISGTAGYRPDLLDATETTDQFSCYFGEIGYNHLVYLCVWLSACVTLERGLSFLCGDRMDANRWQSFVALIIFVISAAGLIAPLFVNNCNENSEPQLKSVRPRFVWIYCAAAIVVYTLAAVLVVIGVTRPRRGYIMDKNLSVQTVFDVLEKQIFIFVPPIMYAICFLPCIILTYSRYSKVTHVGCGIFPVEYTVSVLIETLTYLPVTLTWLIFVYPSKPYMNEFYVKTWSGKCCLKISIFIKSLIVRKQKHRRSYSYIGPNRRDINVFVIEIHPLNQHE